MTCVPGSVSTTTSLFIYRYSRWTYDTAAPNQEVTAQDVENACRLSKADEFIDRLEGGYQTYGRSRGTNLSGGRRQRLCYG